MTHLGMLLLTYAAVVCQTSLADAISVRGIAPDVVGLVVVVSALSLRGGWAIFWAALAGLAADCLSSTHLGVNMLIAVALTYFVQTFVGNNWRKSIVAQLLLGFLLVVTLVAGSAAAQLLLHHQSVAVNEIVPWAIKTATYSILIAAGARFAWSALRRIVPGLKTTSRTQTSDRWAMVDR